MSEPLCLKNQCGFLWKIEQFHQPNSSYTFYRSPTFSSCSGKPCRMILQSSQNRDYSPYVADNNFAVGPSRSFWRVDIIFPDYKDSVDQNVSAYNCTSYLTYSSTNENRISVDLVLKMKQEMNSPPIYFAFNAIERGVKQIQLTIFISTISKDVEKYCELAWTKMQSYFSDLITNNEFSDVKIEVEEKIFPGHKAVLAAHSEVFQAMFRADMIESESGVITITDLKADGIRRLLKFVYTHKDPMLTSFESAEDLYRAAHKYQIDDLLNIAREYLLRFHNETNVFELLVLANKFSDAVLKNAAMLFFADHPEFCPEPERCKEIIVQTPEVFSLFLNILRAVK